MTKQFPKSCVDVKAHLHKLEKGLILLFLDE